MFQITDPLVKLTFFCKLKKQFSRKRIVEQLEANDLISASQSGFRSVRSMLS